MSLLNEQDVALKEFHKIPGVAKAVAIDLWNLGFKSISDLKKQDSEKLKWWNWMDKEKITSKEKDKQIQERYTIIKKKK